MSAHKVFIFAFFFYVVQTSPRCDMSTPRFLFWPKYVGPIGFQPGFWLKTFVLPLCGTPNGDRARTKRNFLAGPGNEHAGAVECVLIVRVKHGAGGDAASAR